MSVKSNYDRLYDVVQARVDYEVDAEYMVAAIVREFPELGYKAEPETGTLNKEFGDPVGQIDDLIGSLHS